ncbi:MAG: DNA cytosine methyltransferase [Bombella sp.]|nr:DNA cytosine methyltransferase [Bombella sp.]
MTKRLKVLSLFDGISCGLQALKNLNIPIETYDAFEIDKYAIMVSKKNHPEINHHGSVVGADFSKFKGYDLLIGGFACQSFSGAGKQLGFDDPRGQLFFDLIRALEQVKPKYFLFENVVMKKEYSDKICELLGVPYIMIDSAKLSSQTRKRLYWTNIPNVTQPQDLGLLLKDIIHENEEQPVKITDRNIRHFKHLNQKSLTCTATMYKGAGNNGMSLIQEYLKEYIVPFDETFHFLEKEVQSGKMGYFRKDSQANRVYYINNKSVTLCGDAGGGAAKMGQYFIGDISFDASDDRKIFTLENKDGKGVLFEGYIRKLTVLEVERLQTLPDFYTECEGVSNTQRYKSLGNGWTCKIIEHILLGLL